jgi:hypothetical protein
MSILANGSLAKIIAGATQKARVTESATLHSRTAGTDADGVPAATFTDYPVTVTPLDISAYRREAGRIPDTDSDALIYHGSPAAPRTGDEITVRATRFEIMSRLADPAAATWQCRLRILTATAGQ